VARRSLKPQLNQIRTWVRQGRTDAWIAHQLEVSVKDLDSFKREHDLVPADADDGGRGADEELDLRAEDDALVAAALEADDEDEDEGEDEGDEDEEAGDGDSGEDEAPRRRRRGRRGGRSRRGGGRAAAAKPLEGTFDHGDEGYGLWLDPAIQDDAVYAEHWQGHRPVTITVERDRIVIRRAGEEEPDDDSGESEGPPLDPDDFDA
jgi:hypothetical protein